MMYDMRPKYQSTLLLGLGAFALGAGLMYLFDPARGRSRRTRVQNRLTGMINRSGRILTRSIEDSRNRIYGLTHDLRKRFGHGRVSDYVLVDRVRAALGHAISHPHGIQCLVTDGVVTLRGDVAKQDVPQLLRTVRGVPGVRDIRSDLYVHEMATA